MFNFSGFANIRAKEHQWRARMQENNIAGPSTNGSLQQLQPQHQQSQQLQQPNQFYQPSPYQPPSQYQPQAQHLYQPHTSQALPPSLALIPIPQPPSQFTQDYQQPQEYSQASQPASQSSAISNSSQDSTSYTALYNKVMYLEATRVEHLESLTQSDIRLILKNHNIDTKPKSNKKSLMQMLFLMIKDGTLKPPPKPSNEVDLTDDDLFEDNPELDNAFDPFANCKLEDLLKDQEEAAKEPSPGTFQTGFSSAILSEARSRSMTTTITTTSTSEQSNNSSYYGEGGASSYGPYSSMEFGLHEGALYNTGESAMTTAACNSPEWKPKKRKGSEEQAAEGNDNAEQVAEQPHQQSQQPQQEREADEDATTDEEAHDKQVLLPNTVKPLCKRRRKGGRANTAAVADWSSICERAKLRSRTKKANKSPEPSLSPRRLRSAKQLAQQEASVETKEKRKPGRPKKVNKSMETKTNKRQTKNAQSKQTKHTSLKNANEPTAPKESIPKQAKQATQAKQTKQAKHAPKDELEQLQSEINKQEDTTAEQHAPQQTPLHASPIEPPHSQAPLVPQPTFSLPPQYRPITTAPPESHPNYPMWLRYKHFCDMIAAKPPPIDQLDSNNLQSSHLSTMAVSLDSLFLLKKK